MELLVVISIVALLAGLLLPSLARAKTSAKSVVCKNNLRQQILALTLYEQDHEFYPGFMDGELPYAVGGEGVYSMEFWADRLRPYTKSEWTSPLFRCPGYHGETDPALGAGRTVMPWHSGSYGYNAYGTGSVGGGGAGGIDAMQLGLGSGSHGNARSKKHLVGSSQVKAPSEMIALGDATLLARRADGTSGSTPIRCDGMGVIQYAWGRNYYLWGRTTDADHVALDRANRLRHPKGALNLAFCDGHLESITSEDLFAVRTNMNRPRWNKDNAPHYETYK